MQHTRTLDPHSPHNLWEHTRWALDHEAIIAWPGSVYVRERIEPVEGRDGLVRIVRDYENR